MYKFLLNFIKLGWLAPVIEPILTAKSSPTPENIETATFALANAIVSEYKPDILPEVESIEATIPSIVAAAITMKSEPGVQNGEALAKSLLSLVEVFVPNIPDDLATEFLVVTGKILQFEGVK